MINHHTWGRGGGYWQVEELCVVVRYADGSCGHRRKKKKGEEKRKERQKKRKKEKEKEKNKRKTERKKKKTKGNKYLIIFYEKILVRAIQCQRL